MDKRQLNRSVDRREADLCSMADRIFDHPELALEEVFASNTLAEYLEKNGFSVEQGVAGLETAFRATWENGKGGPTIGLLCEYDALAGLGHGCGHHMQGPSILGAAAALKEGAEDKPFKLVVYGTPAEESVSGKYLMIRNGCTFEELDIALMMHGGPATQTDIKSLASVSYSLTYKGISTHAAVKPEAGRSSLDAMVLAFHGLECLREHVRDDVRIHYNITDTGGTPANIVPSLTKADIFVRSESTEYLETVKARVEKIFKGAAMMTETETAFHTDKQLDSKLPNYCINERLMKNAEAVDAPCRRPPRERTGSTDFANVMRRVPGSCIRVAFVPEGTVAHSAEFIKAGKCEEAHKAIIYAAKILADTAADFIDSPELLKQAKDEFRHRLEAAAKDTD